MLALLALAAATPVAAQEWLVHRERFRYIGTRLTIEVDAQAAGSLRILRGQDGWVAVAGRTPAGFTSAGLTDHDHLTLTAAGAGPVDYMVTVPEGVRVNVRLPDRFGSESVGGHTRVRSFDWSEAAAAQTARVLPPLPPQNGAMGGLFTTYTAPLAPERVALPDLRSIRSVTVRTGGDRFRIATTRPLSLERGDPSRFEIRPAGEPMDIVIEIPAGTAVFGLIAGDAPALIIDGTALNPRCTPVTRQWLSDGREWVTFTPVDGRLDCGPASDARHKG